MYLCIYLYFLMTEGPKGKFLQPNDRGAETNYRKVKLKATGDHEIPRGDKEIPGDATAGNGRQWEAMRGNERQRDATGGNGKQREARAGN